MSRRNFGDGQEIVFEDLNKISPALQREIYDRLAYQMFQRVENAFCGDSFQVGFSNANSVILKKGLGFITDNSSVSPEPKRRPLVLEADKTITITPPHATLDRIDIVCVKAQLVDEITEQRNYKDATSDEVTLQNFVTQKDWEADAVITAGTPNAVPVAPGVPSGYIKISTIAVTAVSGIVDANAITDNRTLMPVGGEALINTLGFSKLTAGANTPLKTLLSDIDLLLTKIAIPILFKEDANAPIFAIEDGVLLHRFEAAAAQKLYAMIRVPTSYEAGKPIKLKLLGYSGDNTGNILMTAVATLIRKGTDAITSSANQHTSTNTALTLSAGTVDEPQEVSCDLTDADGEINSVAVSPGDLIKVQLTRGTDTATGEVKLITDSGEVVFNE